MPPFSSQRNYKAHEQIVSFFHNLWIPPTDVYETPDEIVVKMAISGIKPDDIFVEISGGTLTISGKRFDNANHEKVRFYQVEIRYGYFERKIALPKAIDENNINATYKDGFLLVTIPKAKPPATKTLPVKISL